MAEGEDPAEGAEHGLLAPAARGASTLDGAHLLDESADDCEQEIETQHPTDQLGHTAERSCVSGSVTTTSHMELSPWVDSQAVSA